MEKTEMILEFQGTLEEAHNLMKIILLSMEDKNILHKITNARITKTVSDLNNDTFDEMLNKLDKDKK